MRQCECDLGRSTLLLLGVLGALMVELLSPARPLWRTVTLLWKGELDLTDMGDSSVLAGPGVTVRRNILGELIRAFVIKLEKEGDELSSWCSFPWRRVCLNCKYLRWGDWWWVSSLHLRGSPSLSCSNLVFMIERNCQLTETTGEEREKWRARAGRYTRLVASQDNNGRLGETTPGTVSLLM